MWCPDLGQDESTAREIRQAYSHEDAASTFAQRAYNEQEFDEITLHVLGHGETKVFVVRTYLEANFYATEVRGL